MKINVSRTRNPYFLGRQILTVGTRVGRGRALKYRACQQNLACHFGGVIISADSADSQLYGVIGRSSDPPFLTRRGSGLRELHTNSLKLCIHIYPGSWIGAGFGKLLSSMGGPPLPHSPPAYFHTFSSLLTSYPISLLSVS